MRRKRFVGLGQIYMLPVNGTPFKTIKIINFGNYSLCSHSIMHCGSLTQMQLKYVMSLYWPTAFPQHLLCPCSILTKIRELTPAKINVRTLSCLLMVIRQLTLAQLSFGDFSSLHSLYEQTFQTLHVSHKKLQQS